MKPTPVTNSTRGSASLTSSPWLCPGTTCPPGKHRIAPEMAVRAFISCLSPRSALSFAQPVPARMPHMRPLRTSSSGLALILWMARSAPSRSSSGERRKPRARSTAE